MKRQTKTVQKQLSAFIKMSGPTQSTQNPEKSANVNISSDKVAKGDTIRLFAWNVNGIRAVLKSGELKSFIDKARPQILCLNETKIDDDTLTKDGIMQEIEKLGFKVKN